jgi:hypothetical protein
MPQSPSPHPPVPSPPVCGFDGNGAVVSERDLRDAVVAVAVAERSVWFDSNASPNVHRKETDSARFPDLARYWLAGNDGSGDIRPDTLNAVQTALATSSFGRLVTLDDARLTAHQGLKLAEKQVERRKHSVRSAETAVANAGAVLIFATTARKGASPQNLAAADQALASARQARDAADQALAAAQTALTGASRLQADKERDFQQSDRSYRRDRLNLLPPEARRLRRQLLLSAPGASAPGNLATLVEQALMHAHPSHSDIALNGITAWSAVFVVSCIRKAGINCGLEAVVGGAHQGTNGLLLASFRHSTYVIEAHRRTGLRDGTYHAFNPRGRRVEKGDIIVQDRHAGSYTQVQSFNGIPNMGQRKLHCDIVTSVAGGVAETIGGNLGPDFSGSVRSRRYPLDANGELIVDRTRLYWGESDNGTFPVEPGPVPASAQLPQTSTFRVFALLSPVPQCLTAPIPGSPPASVSATLSLFRQDADKRSPWPISAKQKFNSKSFGQLESPFLVEEVLPNAGPNGFDSSVEKVVQESPFSRAVIEARSEAASIHRHWEESQWSRVGKAQQSEGEFLHGDGDAGEEVDFDPDNGEDLGYEEPEGEWVGIEYDDLPAASSLASSSNTLDPLLAVPAFDAAKRSVIGTLLTPTQNRSAIQSTTKNLKKAGISAGSILGAIQHYVDLPSVTQAINDYNANGTNTPIAFGTKPVDAEFVEAIHQFQRKCYKDLKQHDGVAGPSVLDSLGFWPRLGMLSSAQTNELTKKRLRSNRDGIERALSSMSTTLAQGITVAAWWSSFVNPCFIGWSFNRPIHIYFARKLRTAEQWLLTQGKYSGSTPAELATLLDINEEHRGGRIKGVGFHTFGLALDIKYKGNPHIGDYVDKPNGAKYFSEVMKRAATRISNLTLSEKTFPRYLHSLGANTSKTTSDIYDDLVQRDQDFRKYLALPDADANLDNLKKFFKGSEPRDPANGFLNLQKDLVIALRDHACLAWGAVDFGPNASGDVMHFDCRLDDLGRAAGSGLKAFFSDKHPCSLQTTVKTRTRTREGMHAEAEDDYLAEDGYLVELNDEDGAADEIDEAKSDEFREMEEPEEREEEDEPSPAMEAATEGGEGSSPPLRFHRAGRDELEQRQVAEPPNELDPYGGYDLIEGDRDSTRRYGGKRRERGASQGAQPSFVGQLQQDLRTLGFLGDTVDGVLGVWTVCLVREFQIATSFKTVGVETTGPASDRHSSNLTSTGNSGAPVAVTGVVDSATRAALQAWLRNRWRCPIVVEAWTLTRGGAIDRLAHANLWRHDDHARSADRMFVFDLSSSYTYPPGYAANGIQVLGQYSSYRRLGGPESKPPNHTWPNAEILPNEVLFPQPNGAAPTLLHLTPSQLATFKVIRAVSEVECNGYYDGMNAYDDVFISLGPYHSPLGRVDWKSGGELGAILSYFAETDASEFYEAFERFGVRAAKAWAGDGATLFDASQRRFSSGLALLQGNGKFDPLPVGSGQEYWQRYNWFRGWHWFHRFMMSARTSKAFQKAIWDYARIRLRELLQTPWDGRTVVDRDTGFTRLLQIGDIYTSERSVALILRWFVRFPAHIVQNGRAGKQLRAAFVLANLDLPADPLSWNLPDEKQLVDGIFAQIQHQMQQAPDPNRWKGLNMTMSEVRRFPRWAPVTINPDGGQPNRANYMLDPAIGPLSIVRTKNAKFPLDDGDLSSSPDPPRLWVP